MKSIFLFVLFLSLKAQADSGLFKDFPERIQEFITETIENQCEYSHYISGYYEEPVEKIDKDSYYTAEIVLRDYEGNGWITVKESSQGDLNIVNLLCPYFFD